MRPVARAYFDSPKATVSITSRYGLAVVSVALAIGIGMLLGGFPLPLFLMAVAITVWYARMGAGLLAIILSMLSLDRLFTPHITNNHLRYFSTFTLFALVIGWLSASRRRSERALEEARNELEAKVAERTAELRQTTSEAVAARHRFGDLVNSIEGIVWEADAKTFAITFVSDQAKRMLGHSTREWLGGPTFWQEHIHPDDSERVLQSFRETVAAKRNKDLEYRMIGVDGRVMWMRDLVCAVVENDVTTRLRGVMVDITRRKHAEEALQRSEAYLVEAQTLAHMGSWACNFVTKQMFHASEELIYLYRLSRDKGVPSLQDFYDRVHTDDEPALTATLERAIREGTDFHAEFRVLLPDIGTRYHLAIGHPSGNADEYIGITLDITERKRAEEERERLRQLEADLAHINRVTTMGELTASLAHEINQPITAAVVNAETCMQWLSGDNPDIQEAREAATRVAKDATRAAEIISRLRLLFKKGTAERELVNVNEVIGEIVMLLQNEARRSGVSIRTSLAQNSPLLTGDRVQLQQVVMNLMINAIDAMKRVDDRRELTVSTHVNGNQQLLVSVSDTGVGLPPEADQIFDAFFTTKPHGTGMGLAISRTIIESHGGRLRANPNSGRGAVFSFTLPITPQEQA